MKVPFAPVPTGRHVPRTWLESGVVKEGNSFEELAVKIGVPPEQLRATADRFAEPGVDRLPVCPLPLEDPDDIARFLEQHAALTR